MPSWLKRRAILLITLAPFLEHSIRPHPVSWDLCCAFRNACASCSDLVQHIYIYIYIYIHCKYPLRKLWFHNPHSMFKDLKCLLHVLSTWLVLGCGMLPKGWESSQTSFGLLRFRVSLHSLFEFTHVPCSMSFVARILILICFSSQGLDLSVI